MADLQPYCFEPERVPNPEDSEHENRLYIQLLEMIKPQEDMLIVSMWTQ